MAGRLLRMSMCCVIAVFSAIPAHSQQVILNTRGERIVVYPDGSWRYFEQADSTLLNRPIRTDDVVSPDAPSPDETLLRQAHPAADTDISALAKRFAQRTSDDVRTAHLTLTHALNEKFATEAKLAQARKNKKLIEADLKISLEAEYALRTKAVKTAHTHLKWIGKIDSRAQAVLAMPIEKKSKALDRLIVEYDGRNVREISPIKEQTYTVDSRTRETPPPVVAARAPKTSVNLKSPVSHITPTLGSAADYTRALPSCNVQRQSGARTTAVVEKRILFRHTDEELRPYFGTQDLVTCYASLLQIESNLYLSLDFVIASPDARKNFGILENKSMLRLRFLDGTFLTLFNTRVDYGRIDAYTGNTIFTGSYLLDKNDEKLLMKQELDKLRIMWSTGYEDYDVPQIDFFIQQFACLRS